MEVLGESILRGVLSILRSGNSDSAIDGHFIGLDLLGHLIRGAVGNLDVPAFLCIGCGGIEARIGNGGELVIPI